MPTTLTTTKPTTTQSWSMDPFMHQLLTLNLGTGPSVIQRVNPSVTTDHLNYNNFLDNNPYSDIAHRELVTFLGRRDVSLIGIVILTVTDTEALSRMESRGRVDNPGFSNAERLAYYRSRMLPKLGKLKRLAEYLEVGNDADDHGASCVSRICSHFVARL